VDLRERVKVGECHATDLFGQLKHLIGSEGHLAFVTPAFAVARKTLEVLRKQGQLPPDVSADLVSRLLREGRCICETELGKDSAARMTLEKLQAQCMSAVLGRDLAALYDSISSADAAFPAGTKALGEKAKRLWAKYQAAVNENAQVEEQLRVAEAKHDTRAHARREQLRRRRMELQDELSKAKAGVMRLEGEIRQRESRLVEVGNELRRVRGVPEEAKKWQACEDTAERLVGYVEQFETNLLRFCHNRLQELTATMYDETVNDGSTAWIDPDTLLPSIRHGLQSGGAWGGGQSQVLILSYICALSELRKEVCEKMRDLFSVNLVNEQCFFMDCVFGAMEPKYQASVARSLRGRMKQLVLLFNPTQWTEAIRDELKGHVQRAYALRNSVTRDETDEYQKVAYYGRPVLLSFNQGEGTEAVTLVQEIK
jgi:DNA sulfur modification protein DndD